MSDLATPSAVADFLLVECRDRGEVLTHLKLQKLTPDRMIGFGPSNARMADLRAKRFVFRRFLASTPV